MINLELYIDNQRVDLFKDENVLINLSIKNFQQIDKVLNDYTQSFTVPSSSNNNQIFEHWYDKSVTTSFNPAVKIPARIELNSMLFRRGVVQINSATIKGGNIDYYDVTFFGGTGNLAKLFGDDYINQLDLSAYDVDWSTFDTAMAGRVLSNNVLIPLISTTRNWQYNTHTNSSSIRYEGTNSYGIEYDEVRPAIRLKAILDAIEVKYGVTFTSTFFDSADFGNLYMWACRTAGLTTGYAGNFVKMIGGFVSPAPGTFYDTTNDWWTLTTSNTTPLQSMTFTLWSGLNYYDERPIEVIMVDANNSNEILHRRTYNSLYFEDTFTILAPDTGGDAKHIFFAVRSAQRDAFQFDFSVFLGAINVDYGDGAGDEYDVVDFKFTDEVSSADPITGETRVYKGNLPNQTVTEFLGGLVNMFNLVIEPISETEFTIEPLDDYYALGTDLNIGKYVDNADYQVKTAELFGEINFKYFPSESILAQNFRKENDQGYGDLRSLITDSNGDPLSSRKFDIELPFINFLWERLTNLTVATNPLLNILVAKNINLELEPIIEKPYIFYYVSSPSIASNRIAIKNVRSDDASILTNYNLCYNFNSATTFTKSLNFGSEINPYTLTDGTVSGPSLFNNYWEDYITDLYDLSQRRYQFKGVLPVGILIDLKLNSTIIIGLNTYRIISIQANLTTGEATLDLMNIIA